MLFKVKSCLGTYRNHQLKRKLLFVLEDLVYSKNTFISYDISQMCQNSTQICITLMPTKITEVIRKGPNCGGLICSLNCIKSQSADLGWKGLCER